MPQTLTALVVTRDRLDHLQTTLAALLDSAPKALSCVVVLDNASSDGTSVWLAAQTDPRLIVLTQSRNLGGAGGFEAGLAHIRDHLDPDWIVMMDDDARPEIGALEQFHSIDRSTHDAWVTAVRYPSGGICDMNRPWINPFWSMGGFLKGLSGGRGGFHIKDSAYEEPAPMEIDGGSFVGLFWSRGALKKAGLPQGRLFLYGDDVLYCLALRRAGGRVAFDPALRFLHDCETFEESDGTIAPLWKVYYMRRNQVMVYRRAAGLFFWPVFVGFAVRWWTQAPRYGGQATTYRRVLKRALLDGVAQCTELSLDAVQKLADPDL